MERITKKINYQENLFLFYDTQETKTKGKEAAACRKKRGVSNTVKFQLLGPSSNAATNYHIIDLDFKISAKVHFFI